MPCGQKEILISSKCQNVKFQIGRSKCQVRVGGEGMLDCHYPIRHWFLFPSSIIPKTCFFFCWTKMEYNANFFYHQSRLANEMSRDEAFSHYVKCIFWKHEKTDLTIFFAKNCINIKSSIQDPHREIRMFCIILINDSRNRFLFLFPHVFLLNWNGEEICRDDSRSLINYKVAYILK